MYDFVPLELLGAVIMIADLNSGNLETLSLPPAPRRRVVLDGTYLYFDQRIPGTDGSPGTFDIFFYDLSDGLNGQPQPILADPALEERLSDAEGTQIAFERGSPGSSLAALACHIGQLGTECILSGTSYGRRSGRPSVITPIHLSRLSAFVPLELPDTR